MAPICLLNQFQVLVCNRTNEDLIAISEQFESEKSSCLVTIPSRSRQSYLCQDTIVNGIASQSAFNASILTTDNIILGHLAIPYLHFTYYHRNDNRASNDSRWTSIDQSADTNGNFRRFRMLHRCSPTTFSVHLLILPWRDGATYMSCIPDEACLTSLSIPGTHESLARYGWPVSTCQPSKASVIKQLKDGIRFLDVRLAPKGYPGKERLLAYHGITDERIEFSKVLEQCFEFLDGDGRNETLFMSFKREQGDEDLFVRLLFETYVYKSPASADARLGPGSDRWFLEDRVPLLGEARGRIIMLSRFDIPEDCNYSAGIRPTTWPNSFKGTFTYNLRGSNQQVQTQDWYDIGYLSSIPDKLTLIRQLCQESGCEDDVFSLNYCNGSSFPFALPPAVAKGFLHDGSKSQKEMALLSRVLATEGVNSQLRNFVADRLFSSDSFRKSIVSAVDQLKITWAIDYYNEPAGAKDLIPLLIEANF